jgi:hypothetical protein
MLLFYLLGTDLFTQYRLVAARRGDSGGGL